MIYTPRPLSSYDMPRKLNLSKAKKMLRSIARALGRGRKHCSERSVVSFKQELNEAAFPLELFELIIDYVWPDRQSLQACALVCRSWHSRARYNLFYTVELHNQVHLAHLAAMLIKDSRLGSTIRELHVTPYRTQSQVFGEFPFVLGGYLTKVNHLRVDIKRDYYPYMHPEFFGTLGQFGRSVTMLELHRIQFPSLHDFGMIVCAFPRLESLSCWMVGWVKKTYEASAFKGDDGRLALQRLYMRNIDWSAEMVDWFLTVLAVRSLSTVVVPALTARDVEHVGRLLDAIGSSLEHLSIGITPRNQPRVQSKTVTDYDGDIGAYPRLVHNTSLTSVHLDLYGGGNWAAGMLAQTVSPRISHISVSMPTVIKPSKLKQFHFGSLDGILSLPQFSALRKLVLQYEATMEQDRLSWFHAEAPTRFPLAYAKRIVEFEPVTREWWEVHCQK